VQKDCPTLKLPLVFLKLRYAVEHAGGFETEGIFRLSANLREVEDYVEAIKENNESNDSISPHIPASAMKQWLREMEIPPIPFNFYDEATRLGNAADPNEASVVAGMNKLVTSLPAVNRSVLHALAHLSQKISSKGYVETTKMSIANLSIVFSPCIIRLPEGNDPELYMQMCAVNSRAEITFTSCVLKNLEVDESLIHLDFDPKSHERRSKA
jgi:hypothetical protein